MADSFLNSLFVAIPATVIPIMIAAFAAYAFAWLEFPGRHVLFTVIIGLLVVPLQMTFIPILRVYNAIGLTGTFPAIWLAHAALDHRGVGDVHADHAARDLWLSENSR